MIALALIGFFNIIGSFSAGIIGQRYSKPYFLALIYLARSVVVSAFLLLPQTPTSVIVFAVVMGLLWLSTVPPTNGLVAIMFGTRHLGLLGGIVFLSHQIGSFLAYGWVAISMTISAPTIRSGGWACPRGVRGHRALADRRACRRPSGNCLIDKML